MYTLKQPNEIIDQIKLEKNNGESDTLDIKLKINIDVIRKFRELQIKLVELQKDTEHDPSYYEAIGKTVYEVFTLLFGEENTEKLFAFYSDDFTQMIADLTPYIQNVIFPRFESETKARKNALKRKKW